MFRSVTTQMLHYLARPHQGPPREPLRVPAAWRSSDLETARYDLGAEEVEELETALRSAVASGKPMAEWTRADFPLPSLSSRIAEWQLRLRDGLGVQLVRGVPVDRWSREDAERFFWALGLHLGIPGAQNGRGDLLGHVTRLDAREAHENQRQYQTNERIEYHCDAADVVGLLCLHPAREGGKSRIASSVTIYNELLARAPNLAMQLFEPFWLDTRGDGFIPSFPVPPCRHAGGKLRTFYHSGYFRSARLPEKSPALSEPQRRVLDLYDEIASSEGVFYDMDLQIGDIQLISNHTVVHSRTSYDDDADPARRRHLLRLWLSLPQSDGWLNATRRAGEFVRLATGIGAAWWRWRKAGHPGTHR